MRSPVPASVVGLLLSVAAPCASLLAQSHAAASPAGKADHAAPHWAYDGSEGPHAWGRIDPSWRACSVGREQSPIDLGGAIASKRARIAERFAPSPFVFFHNGHTVQAALAKPSVLTIDGVAYNALQFHFHHPSEHTVRGKAYPAELHLVHKSQSGELAVLGVFLEIGAGENPDFDGLASQLPAAAGDSIRVAAPLDLAALLDDGSGMEESVYTYHGSLTTPPCSEGVRWTVRERPIVVSFRQMQRLVAVLGESARPVQPVNERR